MNSGIINRSQGLIKLKAPAKINLYLAVKGKRADGYHEIESLMQKINLADQIQLSIGGQGIRLTCVGADLPTDKGNLVYRAADAFLRKIGRNGVDINLEKKIPVAAGLGGGSSDAAAVLRGLNKLFDTELPAEELLTMAKSLGADVPFFMYDWSAAWATGIGEDLTPAESLTDCHLVLVNPGFSVSTGWVYKNFALTSGSNTFILARDRQSGDSRSLWRPKVPDDLYNDLEAVTIPHYPEIEQIKNELQQDGAVGVLMSGSGPTVFGLFNDPYRAGLSYARLGKEYGDTVFHTRPYQSDISS